MINRRIVQHLLAAIQMLDEFRDPAGKTKFRRFVAALVGKRDLQAFVQKRQLAQALRQKVIAINRRREDFRIGMKSDLRARFSRLSGLLQLAYRLAALVGLFPYRAVAADLDLERIRQRVHHGNAHAVQSAGDLVRIRIEFSAGV